MLESQPTQKYLWRSYCQETDVTAFSGDISRIVGALKSTSSSNLKVKIFEVSHDSIRYSGMKDNKIKGILKLDRPIVRKRRVTTITFEDEKQQHSFSFCIDLIFGARVTSIYVKDWEVWRKALQPSCRFIDLLERYSLDQNPIGVGEFGEVLKARCRVTSRLYAVKKMSKAQTISKLLDYNVQNEAMILKKLDKSRFTPKFCEIQECSDAVYIIMDLVHGITLEKLIKEKKGLCLIDRLWIMKELFSAIENLCENGIIHRDLNLNNIIVDYNSKQLYLIDFGLSADISTPILATMVGTPGYIAPEVFNQMSQFKLDYGPKSDVYSISAILYKMICGDCPPEYSFDDISIDKKMMIVSNRISSMNIELEEKDLILNTLNPKEENRYTATEALHHSYFYSEFKEYNFNPMNQSKAINTKRYLGYSHKDSKKYILRSRASMRTSSTKTMLNLQQ